MSSPRPSGARNEIITTTLSATNETTKKILNFLFQQGVFAYRHNVLPIPIPGGGFRPGSKSGISDIIGIIPPDGKFLAIEVKTGRDRLRPEQEGFLATVVKFGGLAMVVKDFNDFELQWNTVVEK